MNNGLPGLDSVHVDVEDWNIILEMNSLKHTKREEIN